MYPTPESYKYPEIEIIDDAYEKRERGLITEDEWYTELERANSQLRLYVALQGDDDN